MGPQAGDQTEQVIRDMLMKGQMCHLKDWLILGGTKSPGRVLS